MVELLNCPFCGGKPKVTESSGDERVGYANVVKVQCPGCGASHSAMGDTSKGGYADNSTTEQRAVEKWNRRATPSSPSTAPKVWIKHLTGAECKPDGRCYDIAFAPMPGYTEYSAAASGTAPTVEVDERAEQSLQESIDTPEFLDLVCSWRDGIQDGALWSDIISAITDYARNEVRAALASKPPAREAAEIDPPNNS